MKTQINVAILSIGAKTRSISEKEMQYSLELITCDPLIFKLIPTKSITTEEKIYGVLTHNWACSVDFAFAVCEQ